MCLDRGRVDLVVAVLAVVKAGGAYLPVDPRLPGRAGRRSCWRMPGVAVVLTDGRVAAEVAGGGCRLQVTVLDDRPAGAGGWTPVDAGLPVAAGRSTRRT